MIPTIGVVLCLYVFTRCLDLASSDAHTAVKISAGLTAIGAMVGAALLVKAASDAQSAIESLPLLLP